MATQQPIATISYNSEKFLKAKLDEWFESHLIQAYQYIFHVGEEGDKNHFHVRIEPNKRLDKMDLFYQLKEIDPNNEKPLGCRPWRPSKEEPWILYAIHDKDFLDFKYGGGEKSEKKPYKIDDVKCSDLYDLETMLIRAKIWFNHNDTSIARKLASGVSPFDLIIEGESAGKVNQINNALYNSDYQRLQVAYNKLENELNMYKLAAEESGFFLNFSEDNKPYFEKYGDVIPFI